MRSKRILALLLALFVFAAAACGDDDGGAETSTDDEAGLESTGTDDAGDNESDEASSEPVEIDHIFGTTTVDEEPERIVSLGTQWTDVLLAMGTPPVGYVDDTLGADRGLFAWQADLMPEESTSFTATDGIPFEKIAALQPDLIVATHYVTEQVDYDTLSDIAPTIPPLNGAELVDPWQELTEVAGHVLREEDAAEQIMADYEEMVTDAAQEFPNLEGKTYSFANYLPDAIWVVANPTDGATQFFGELGLEIAPDLLELAGDGGRAQISHEQAGLLDSDLILMLTNDLDPSDLPGFDQLPAVKSGAFVETSFDEAVALNTPSPISLRHVLDVIRPALEAANGT